MTSAAEVCDKKRRFCQSKFPQVQTMTSDEFLLKYERHTNKLSSNKSPKNNADCDLTHTPSNRVVLVDVRTEAEKNVSMISGSISLQAFENDFHTLATTEDTDIVFYCTIGYRSGMEAARICDEYNIDRGRVYSLDGIVPYTHALKSHRSSDTSNVGCASESTASKPSGEMNLITPSGEKTKNVHTFGNEWNCVDMEFNPISFGTVSLLVHTFAVGLRLLSYKIRRIFFSSRKK